MPMLEKIENLVTNATAARLYESHVFFSPQFKGHGEQDAARLDHNRASLGNSLS
jgi:hypothetical protein